MFNRNRNRRRRLATLAGIGLSLALLRGKGRMRRYAMWRLINASGFGPGQWGGFGHGRWSQFGPGGQRPDFSQMPLPPFIEARLKTWHDQAHGNPTTPSAQPADVTKV